MRFVYLLLAATVAFTASSAGAAVNIAITQVGDDVVLTGSGTFDLTDLTHVNQDSVSFSATGVFPAGGQIVVTRAGKGIVYAYTMSGTATSFGTGPAAFSSPEYGTTLGLFAADKLFYISNTYVSNSQIVSKSTIIGSDFTKLGLTSGVYTFLSGNNTITVTIGNNAVAAVPEMQTWATVMIGFGAIGFGLRRRKVATRIRFA